MICTMILSLTLVFADGHKETLQRHFNEASLAAFDKQLDKTWSAHDLGLPEQSLSVSDISIVDTKPFTCGTKPSGK